MRKIGELPDEKQAGIFSEALYARGLENDVETEDHGGFSIWVHHDDHLSKGRELLEQFTANPADPQWTEAAAGAAKKRADEEKHWEKRNANVITRERMEYERNFSVFAWVPFVLSVLSILATLWAGELDLMPGVSNMPPAHSEEYFAAKERAKRRETLYITKPMPRFLETAGVVEVDDEGNVLFGNPKGLGKEPLPEIRDGQFWRLFTPMFLHFGILHLLFNIMWLRDLGGFMQSKFGAFYVLVFILAVAAVSNLAQLAVSSPKFGGLSGVNYGLLGYLWMRGKHDRTGFWSLNPQVVQSMIVWLVACFFMPGVANGAHVAGLLFGMLSGFTSAKIANARYRRS